MNTRGNTQPFQYQYLLSYFIHSVTNQILLCPILFYKSKHYARTLRLQIEAHVN